MLLFGICSIVSPWVLGYSAESRPTSSAVILGVLVRMRAAPMGAIAVSPTRGKPTISSCNSCRP
jgi:SPW repeat